MRRLDLHPLRKLRNPGRHLRALARWPARIASQIPDAAMLEGERFWNFRIPVFSKFSDPPHATPETQLACLAALFAAAEAVEQSARRPSGCRVAVLATTPFLFDSEVTLLFDDDYFTSFLPRAAAARTDWEGGWVEAAPADAGDIQSIRPEAPAGLEFFGGVRLREFANEMGAERPVRVSWVWAYPRR